MNRGSLPLIAAVLLFLAAGAPLSAGDFNVDYVEGRLEYRQGRDTWMPLDIGDSVSEDRTLRLTGRGYAELSDGSRVVTFTRDGVYSGSEWALQDAPSMNLREVIGSKFSALLNRTGSSSDLAVAAVRGAEAEGDDFISWEDESTDYLLDGLALYDAGDIAGARDLFDEGTIWETGAVQRECRFRLALCDQALGDPRSARRTLESLQPEPDDPYLGEYTITMATLYIESREYAAADTLLASYLDSNPRGDAAQASWLLSAYSLQGQGDEDGSRASLRNAVELDRSSPIGRAAADMLN